MTPCDFHMGNLVTRIQAAHRSEAPEQVSKYYLISERAWSGSEHH
jgi:hypothetical protein